MSQARRRVALIARSPRARPRAPAWPATSRSRLPRRAVGHQRRHGLGDRQRLLGRFQQPAAALGDVVGVFLVAGVAERPVQLAQHHLGEADHGVERRAQLVAHLRHQLAQAARSRQPASLVGSSLGAAPRGPRQRQQRRRGAGRHQEGQVPGRQPDDGAAGAPRPDRARRSSAGCRARPDRARPRSAPATARRAQSGRPAASARSAAACDARRRRPAHGRSPPRTG